MNINGQKLVVYAPGDLYKKMKEFAQKYNISVSQLTMYAVVEAMEKLENEKNVSIFEVRKRIRDKIYGYYDQFQEKEVIEKWKKDLILRS